MDLRERVVAAIEAGAWRREAARPAAPRVFKSRLFYTERQSHVAVVAARKTPIWAKYVAEAWDRFTRG